MADHPIDILMTTTMDNIRDMIDVNTILGDPIEASDGTVIVPVSRVSIGFAAGGSEFSPEKEIPDGKSGIDSMTNGGGIFPFGGGAGAGFTIHPVAFLIVSQGQIRVLPVKGIGPLDKLIDFIPSFLEKAIPTEKQTDT